MLPSSGMTTAQTDMVTFIYINQAALRKTYAPAEEAVEDEQLNREDDLISQALGRFRDSIREAQLQALDAAYSEETDSEYKTALVHTA